METKLSYPHKNKSFHIVAIGGSAGSFQALEAFFTHLPIDSGMSFIIILHLNPNHTSSLAEVIQRYTQMPVSQAEEGLTLEQNHVYVIPPNKDMGIQNKKLFLLTPTTFKGLRLPIDFFFQSLADDQWSNAVGIILSGMGSDGATGLKMIKEKLGLAVVQEPITALYNSMPLAAINTNQIDLVLPPEEMPIRLIQYLNHPALSNDFNDEEILEIKSSTAIQKLLMLLRSHTGHDFTLYKRSTIQRRIDRRLAFNQLPDYNHYVDFLQENHHEIEVLFNELLIGVTKFFRDKAAFDALGDKLFLALKDKNDADPIRVWVTGCSTGEEAYSVGILILELLEDLTTSNIPKVQIFATDLDINAIEFARVGLYQFNIVADVSEQRIARFFNKKNDGYQVKKELRELIVFARHNVIKDAPFTRLNLLCCRNLMIYLTLELQKQIIPIFHYSLNPNGIYFMGPAETLGGFADMFKVLDFRWKLYERKEGVAAFGKMVDFPFNIARVNNENIKPDAGEKISRKKSVEEAFKQILIESYTPASVLITHKGDIQYISGKTGNFLELTPGEAVMNIHRMAREEFKYALSNAIHHVVDQKNSVTVPDIKLKEGLETRLATIHITLLESSLLHGLILVVFEDKGLMRKIKNTSKVNYEGTIDVAATLEKELNITKKQLHSTIEQMEISMEELKSTNEELQSTNEEFQSTNEEALTTKEEMQSLNEELMTINIKYQANSEELMVLNSDMKNMLDNTEIGTIFLDNDLNILRFTPQIKKLFNLISSDIGRSITHIVTNLEHDSIADDLKEVIDRLIVKEMEVQTKHGDWYNLRIIPYRTLNNFINGAVMTMVNITPLKTLQLKLYGLKCSIKTMLNCSPHRAIVLDHSLSVINANTQFQEYYELEETEIEKLSFKSFVQEKWGIKNPNAWILKLREENRPYKLNINTPHNENEKSVFLTIENCNKNDDENNLILISIQSEN